MESFHPGLIAAYLAMVLPLLLAILCIVLAELLQSRFFSLIKTTNTITLSHMLLLVAETIVLLFASTLMACTLMLNPLLWMVVIAMPKMVMENLHELKQAYHHDLSQALQRQASSTQILDP